MDNLKILVINGPNLNLTGMREQQFYGNNTLDEINDSISDAAESLSLSVDFFQTNHEGDIIDRIHAAPGAYAGIILNAGALTHYSYAIRDAISAVYPLPVVEVHMSNVNAREDFRRISVIAPVCWGTIAGFGSFSYQLALAAIAETIKTEKEN